MEHHARTLMSDMYKRCRQYSQTDYHRWLVSLHRCGYASDANYVKKCENIIHRYQLYKYDQQVLKG
jgi:flagellum-specific peptidoglycan hydrolase FlgJ